MYGSMDKHPTAPEMELLSPPGTASNSSSDDLLAQMPEQLKSLLASASAEGGIPFSMDYSFNALSCILGACCMPFNGCGGHMLVRQGELSMVWDGDQPFFVGPGRHCLWKPTLRKSAPVNQHSPYIKHGTVHLIRVDRGQLGVAEILGSGPVLFPPGFHMLDSSMLSWRGPVDFKNEITQVGNLSVIRVETGKVGYKYQQAELVVLEPGLHVISPPDRFGGFLSTQQQVLNMPEAVHESSDYVPLRVKADIYFRVAQPYKCLTEVQNLTESLQEIGMATLAGIIRASSLSDIASSSVPSHASEPVAPTLTSSEPPRYEPPPVTKQETFYKHVHDEFLGNLQDHLLSSWGVDISNIRVEYLKIQDEKLAHEISMSAIDACAKDTKYRMLEKESKIIQRTAENSRMKMQIEIEAETEALKMRVAAETDADQMRAQSDKAALELRGQGEKAYAESLSSTSLGAKMAVLKLQAEALSGISKIAYVPHLPGLLEKKDTVLSDSILLPEGQ